MRAFILTTALGFAALVTACGQKTTTNEVATTNEATNASENISGMMGNMPSDMDNMAMPAGAKMASSSGTVTAIDTSAGTITLDHQAIPEAGWPAMTMTFKAKPAVLSGAKVGDKVAFDVVLQGGAGEVTAIQKR